MGDWRVGYLGKRERATATKTFSFERPRELDYRPGQFFFILIPASDPADPWLEHHFSFSSSPTEPDVAFTTRMTGHEFKNRMDELEPGTRVRIGGPDGTLVVRPEMRKIAWVCGGIGITPARSTMRWAADTGADLDIVLLYGNRDEASIAFRDELDSLTSARRRVVNVLSEAGADWTGRTGHIDAAVVREEVPDAAERWFFVTGPPAMAAALTRVLLDEVGMPVDRVLVEHFSGYR